MIEMRRKAKVCFDRIKKAPTLLTVKTNKIHKAMKK